MTTEASDARVVVIVQARLGSVRMPRKVLESLGGRPALQLLLERAARTKSVDEIVLAIPDLERDDPLEELAERMDVRCVRGSEADVLDRYLRAARAADATVVVRLTGDCPLIDHSVIERVIQPVREGRAEWATTGTSFPDGLDVQVATFAVLERAADEATDSYDREHVFPWITRDASLRCVVVEHERDLGAMRITLDEPDDLTVLRAVLERRVEAEIDLAALGKLWDEQPEAFEANRHLVRNEGSATLGTGQKLWRHALNRIPGGSMLLSKRAEMLLPGEWPAYFDRASGCHVWDLDGKRYLDVGLMGVGTNILGYAHPKVDEAVQRVVAKGALSTLNSPEEVELADRLCDLHPWAEMARFTRSGGEACAVAVRIARAASGKDAVAFCGYHGWHDWYLAANLSDEAALDGHLITGLSPAGVPRALSGTSRPFAYNDLDSLEALLEVGDVGTIIMEVERSVPPAPGFLEGVRRLATVHGAVLVFDECTSGFRQVLGGHHLTLGVEPDIAILGKTLGNGFAINAVIGRRPVMEAANRTFISSTFWTERIGPTAALAALAAMQEEDAPARVHSVGLRVRDVWDSLAAANGLRHVARGLPALSVLTVDGVDDRTLRTFLAASMLAEAVLSSNSVYASIAHTDQVLEEYASRLDAVFAVIAAEGEEGLRRRLDGRVVMAPFGRLS
jgi:glutamate-1-semialdehyde 2,1-aminomutase